MRMPQTNTTTAHTSESEEPLIFHYCKKADLEANRDTIALCGKRMPAQEREEEEAMGNGLRIICPLCAFFYEMRNDEHREAELDSWLIGGLLLKRNEGGSHE